jgi:hypothetical protein
MRRLLFLPLVVVLLLSAAAPVAAVEPQQLGPDAPAGASETQPSGTGVTTTLGGGATSEPNSADGTTHLIVSDDVLRLHKAKGAPIGAPDPL